MSIVSANLTNMTWYQPKCRKQHQLIKLKQEKKRKKNLILLPSPSNNTNHELGSRACSDEAFGRQLGSDLSLVTVFSGRWKFLVFCLRLCNYFLVLPLHLPRYSSFSFCCVGCCAFFCLDCCRWVCSFSYVFLLLLLHLHLAFVIVACAACCLCCCCCLCYCLLIVTQLF